MSTTEEEADIDKMLFLIKKNGILYKSIQSIEKQGLCTFDLREDIAKNDKQIAYIVKLYKNYEKFYKKRRLYL